MLGNRLSVRLGLAICLAAGAILVAAGLWNLRLQRSQLTRLLVASATERTDDIRRSTREAMMHDSPGEVGRILRAIAGESAIERIRLFDGRGRIRNSSDVAEIGLSVDLASEQCVACHEGGEVVAEPQQQDRVRIFRAADGGRIVGVISPIGNEPACASAPCHVHPPSQKILGVLDVQLSLREVDESLATSERQMIVGLVASLVAVLGVVSILTWRMVLRPVARLTEAARSVGEGELSTRVPVASADEIGELTENWNAMIAKLGRAQELLERWSRTLEREVEEKTRELAEANQRMLAVERMASLGKLAAVVAHEVNNPLTGIGTYARLLRRRLEAIRSGGDRGKVEAETNHILRMIEEEAARCGEIVRNLLLFSRAPAPTFAIADLETVLQRCVLLLRHQAAAGEVELDLRVDEGLPAVSCDASQVQQMILALALNAIEATPAGGAVTLSARVDCGGDTVVVGVSDTGRGIPAEDLARIHEPFFTTKEQGGGVGLGLAVVHAIVARHHGTIEVDSSPGEGSVFSVRLPRCQPAAGDSEQSASREASR